MLMSKAELARMANVSPITITRIEKGMPCRMDTKRKILNTKFLRIKHLSWLLEKKITLSVWISAPGP
jgi:DNA-binding XRE family transcriptional regulator